MLNILRNIKGILKNCVKWAVLRMRPFCAPLFKTCLSKYCSQQKLILVTELPYKSDAIPDGTVKDSLRLTLGYWEAKDTKDNLNDEISKKIAKGYPTSNIIFENSEIAVLIQDGLETQRVKMSDAKALDSIVRSFLAYEPKQIGDFRKAANQFKDDFPRSA